MISLLAGGGAVACAGVFVLSCRLLLDMLKVFDLTFPKKKRKIITPNNFFKSLQSLREYYFLDITIKLAEISRTFSNQHGGLNSLIPVAMALFLLSHQSPYVRCVIVTPGIVGIVTPTTAEK